jgi:hypothetical protein
VAWAGGAAGKSIPEAERKEADRAPDEPSTCVAVIEEQQALWLALACIVMRPRIRNDKLKKTLGDAGMLIKAGTGHGIDFADAIINEQKKTGAVPQSFPQV